ncbi:MAG: CidA/LrgA family protein [Lachnospiraceae bacterium]|nr:CidA/LrgA family protein [Lachnospiraceae bacterium]
MKYLKQFLVILVITFIGEVLKYLIPLPVPASIYGLLILFAALITGVVKIDMVKDTAAFLIEIMPLMFIPAAVGLMDSWSILKPIWIQISVIIVISTVLVMIFSGRVTQFIIRWEKRHLK